MDQHWRSVKHEDFDLNSDSTNGKLRVGMTKYSILFSTEEVRIEIESAKPNTETEPALAHADVGISLINNADITRTTADELLMELGLHLLLLAIDIDRDRAALVRQNLRLIAEAA